MSALYTVTDGSPADAADLNQLVNTFSSVLGVTDTAQPSLGRLTLPIAVSNPTSPVNGQMWVRSDLGVGSARLHMRHQGQNVPYLPLRQIRLSTILVVEFSAGTSYAEAFADLVFITTGGSVLIKMISADPVFAGTAAGCVYINQGSGGGEPVGFFKFTVDGNSVGEIATGAGQTNQALFIPASSFEVYVPTLSAASHTFNVEIKEESGGDVRVGRGIAILVMELGD